MNCPFLSRNYILVCKARNIYTPSLFQIEEYCRGKRKRYALCPFYKFSDKMKKDCAVH
jgi:hypothetical protein